MKDLDPTIIGALLGGLGSFLVALVVFVLSNRSQDRRLSSQHKHELDLERKQHRREKLEQAYLAFSNWETNFAGVYVGMIGYVKGEMSEDSAFQLAGRSSAKGSNEQVAMLIALYFPKLQSTFDQVRSARGNIVKYFPPNADGRGDLISFYHAQELFEAKAQELKDAMKSEIDAL